LLDALRRLADVAVVMDARLYEVDRALYAKHIAPQGERIADCSSLHLAIAFDKGRHL
jgi:hypothetical protein